MKVAIYVRVSTIEQATEGYSIRAQTDRLKAYCVSQGWDIFEFYIDDGYSAKDTNRPNLKSMMKSIREGLIDCVLVYRLDRLTRSVKDLYNILETFDKYGCKFKSATEVYDTTTAIGRLFITLVAALAQWERENTGERVKMGMSEKVRQGKYVHNQRPFGYDLNLKTGELTINEPEARTVRKMVEIYLDGNGANYICKYLNKRKIFTRDGNQWNDKPVMQILKNPLYAGNIKWSDILVNDAVPPIIDKETYEAIQKTIERRRGLEPKQISSDYIFSGTLKCPSCGHSMVGYKVYTSLANGAKKTYKNYRCNRNKLGMCIGSKSISERALDRLFVEYLTHIDYSNVIQEVAESEQGELREGEQDKLAVYNDLEKVESRKKKWQYAWSNDMISDDDFRKRMEEEREIEEELQQQLKKIEPAIEEITNKEVLTLALQDIRRNWSILNDKEKKNLVQMLIKQIDVAYPENRIVIDKIDFY